MDSLTLILTSILGLICLPFLWKQLSCLVATIRHRREISKCIDKLPGPQWYPIIGTTLAFIQASRKDFWKIFTERNKMYGPLFRTWMGTYPAVHVSTAEHAEIILSNRDNISKGSNYRFISPWLGEGLLTSKGKQWHDHRKFLTPTFHFLILDNFQEVFYEKSQKLVDLLARKADGKYFDITPDLTHCALDIICETAMGTTINALENADSKYVRAVYGMSELAISRMFKAIFHSDFVFNLSKMAKDQKELLSVLHGFTRKVIREKKEKLLKSEQKKTEISEEDQLMGKKNKKAFLDLLLEDTKNTLTDEEIREEVDTFMFAGHDTTAVTTCWILFALANHPEVQEKVHQELDEIFQGKDGPITPDDLSNMKYLDRVIKETLRLYSTVPVIARTLDKDIHLDGYRIPTGCMVVVHLYEILRDPKHFPNPLCFDPDRFLPERSAQRHPFAYIPFSAGPRNCLGQKFASRNSKTIIAAILRRFKIKSTDNVENTNCFAEIVLRPQNGLNVALEDRYKTARPTD